MNYIFDWIKTGAETRKPLDQLQAFLQPIREKSFIVRFTEQDDAAFRRFESYDGKLCIKKMISSVAPDGLKQNTVIRIVSDLKNRRVPIEEARQTIEQWMGNNGITDDKPLRTLEQIYGQPESYSYGCNDEYKKQYCSGKCSLFGHLNPETRPQVLDVPARLMSQGKIPQTRLVEKMLAAAGKDLLKQNGDLYRYTGTHWKMLAFDDEDKIKVSIKQFAGEKVTMPQIEQTFEMFKMEISAVPESINLSAPDSTCANFKNGTLRLRRDSITGVYSLEFQSGHCREDFLTFCLPVDYPTDRNRRNGKFEALLEDAFKDDPDKEAKIRAIRQAGGAMLVAAFAQLIFFFGKSGSRKSTVAKSLCKVVGTENMSFVCPTQMEGFQLEGMVGKLLNVNTDIEDHVPLARGFIKRLEDNMPFQVNRKNRRVVNARLPSIHLYCANELPPNFERGGRAMQRRVLLIEFLRDLTNDNREGEIKYYEDLIFNDCPEGIVNFMLVS